MKDLAVTFISVYDNELLIHTIKTFVKNTEFNIPTDIYVLVQACSKAYILSLEKVLKYFNEHVKNVNFMLHTEFNNLGLSRASNLLYNLTVDYKYVLFLEDDWILIGTDLLWLKKCVDFMIKYDDVATLYLRKYLSEEEKYQYGWTRNIFYDNFEFQDNLNYQNKLGNKISVDDDLFTEIKYFLFSNNPHIRNNNYYKKVYPIIELDDADEEIVIDENGKNKHTSKRWGCAEALTMEKTRSFLTYMFNDGIFCHYSDGIKYLKERDMGPYEGDYDNLININSHIPVLVIHSSDNLCMNYKKYMHEFIRCIHYFCVNDNVYGIKPIISKYKPRLILTINISGVIKKNIDDIISYEYKSKLIHSDNKITINNIEDILFSRLNTSIDEPLVSVITPTYESKSRILRPLTSLISQTYTNWEWIIFDDSITDETWKTLSDFSNSDSRIKIYKRDRNNGSIGDNKLHCAKLSSGNLIFELDHDDEIMPDTFEILINAYKKYPDAGFFYSDCIEIFENTNQPFRYGEYFGLGFGAYYRQWFRNDFHYVYKTHRINPHTIRHIVGVPNHFRCWTKEAYFNVNGNNSFLQVADDYDLIIKSILKYRWCHIPEFLYVQYRNTDGNNFTFHRNDLIQYLVGKIRNVYEEYIHKRFLEFGINDDVYKKEPRYPLDYEVREFEYPIIDYVYKHSDTSDNPLISVIISTYNRPDDLKNALDSVFAQTYKNFEVLLVGDNCPHLDNFVKDYKFSRDKRFKYYNLTKNYGEGGDVPKNYAIKMMCSSEWIAYLDDDNQWKSNHLEIAVDCIRKNKNVKFIVNSMIIEGKELIFDCLRRGRIDTSTIIHNFDLCVKYGLWKSRQEAGYVHDFEFVNRWKHEEKIFTRIPTLIYNTKYNSQTYENLINM
jgi:glycosyltransferase involved in cell wall biosynthesis